MRHHTDPEMNYPPSPPCNCEICRSYCQRPGWWTITQAYQAIEAGYARRMMLEMSPDYSYGVLAPAFRGCEGKFATNFFAKRGCTFFTDGNCEIHSTGFLPLECAFCHHTRKGQGEICHADIGKQWNTPAGQTLVVLWSNLSGLMGEINYENLRRLHKSVK